MHCVDSFYCNFTFCEQTTSLSFVFKNNCVSQCNCFDSVLHCQRVSIVFTGLWCKLTFCEQTTCLSFVFKNNCVYQCNCFDSVLHCQRVSIVFTGLWCKLTFCEQTTCLSFVFKNNCVYQCNCFKHFAVEIDIWLINIVKIILNIEKSKYLKYFFVKNIYLNILVF